MQNVAIVTAWLIFILSVLICIFSVVLIVFADKPISNVIDLWIKPVSDIAVYGGMLFAALALLVAAMAYSQSTTRPKLSLFVGGRNIEDQVLTIFAHSKTRKIVRTQPDWEDIRLTNHGSASARYAVVEIKFALLRAPMTGVWKEIYHDHRGVSAFRWSSGADEMIHPNFPAVIGGVGWMNREIPLSGEVAPDHDVIQISFGCDGFFRPAFSKKLQIRYVSNEAMEEWLMQTFPLQGERLEIQRPDNSMILPDVEWFSCQLGEEAPPSYRSLCNTDIAKQAYWRELFEYWKLKGIVK